MLTEIDFYFKALYNSLGAAILNENLVNFDKYVKKNCAIMLVDDEFEKKATKSIGFHYYIIYYEM